MSRYLVKRLFLIFPTLLLISLLAFFLSKAVPQDPVLSLLNMRGANDSGSINIEAYKNTYEELKLDKANFYFSIRPSHYPPTINTLSDYAQKAFVNRLLKIGIHYTDAIDFTTEKDYAKYIELSDGELKSRLSSTYKLNTFYLPKFHWHGINNQFHKWISGFIKGEFGTSIYNGKAAQELVLTALTWTFCIAVPAIAFTFLFGILIGYFLAKNGGTKKEKILNQVLYLIYAIPVFWIATMAVMYCTTDDYGSWTNIFPSVGIEIHPEATTLQQILRNWEKIILPIIIGSLSSIAYLARILRRSITDEMKEAYITTAYSKGLNHSEVIRKHALPNALLPIITILAGAIPATLGGSVVLEVIFNIPGIGRLLYNSVGLADWDVVFCIIMITGAVTILSFLFADLLYAYFNPKIRYV